MGRFHARRYSIVALLLLCCSFAPLNAQSAIPSTNAVALDGHTVSLPQDFSGLTVVIIGFSRSSADATTAWEIPVRNKLANDRVNFFDLAILERVPSFLHGWVVRSLRGKVPAIVQARFLPVFEHEKEWKQACGFDAGAPDAAYVLLTDSRGNVLWKTHEPYNAANFAQLKAHAGM